MPRLKTGSNQNFKQIWQASVSDYVTALDWSGYHLLATGSAGGDIKVWSWPDRQLLLSYQDQASINSLCWSADGTRLAAAGQGGQVFIWDFTLATDPPPSKPVEAWFVDAWIDRLVWQPGTSVLAFNANRQVYVVDGVSQITLAILDFVESSVLGLSWHPQGRYLAVCGHTGTKVWDSDQWDAEPYLLRVPGASLAAAWTQDGRFLATGNYDRTLSVLEWPTPPPWLMQGFPGKVRQVCWCNQRSTLPLLAAACVEGVTIWFQTQSGSWHHRVLQGHQGFVQSIAFQPHQRLLASADNAGKIYLWHEAHDQHQILSGSTQGFSVLAWHPEGHVLAAGDQGGGIWVWEVLKPEKKGFG